MEIQKSKITDYRPLALLGQGSEGIVYIAEDKNQLKKQVLKVFHKPHTSDWFPGLIHYAENVRANDLGLPDVTLIYDGVDIIGAVYPYIKLTPLHWRALNLSSEIAQSIVGSYSEKQYHLISEYGLVLCDPVLAHFMVDKKGQWHFLDVGAAIRLLGDPKALEKGLIGYRFASLIMGIYDIKMHQLMQPIERYSYDEPCIYWKKNKWLDEIALQHEWVRDILYDVRSHKASIFFDPKFYRRMCERLPTRIPWSPLVLTANKIFYRLDGIQRKLNMEPFFFI